ncbi:MAG: bifunctional isocitrate dehydrogenase kinase/phosphatase, partial [Gammaproteobacteria bacterium]
RLIDTQEFQNLEFPINRFSEELKQELLEEASNTVKIADDYLLFEHVYIERRVKPLNLYIKQSTREAAKLAILDYGQAIKDLAQTNIFPGDLLLKNFGVTRHGRVIFYDYDEVILITDCNFRDIPEANDIIDEMRSDTWYYVDENDIFPQEFIKFLAMDEELRSLFLEVHGDLLTADYWRNIKTKHLEGQISVIVPYKTPGLPNGISMTLIIIIILLTAIFLSVTNPVKETHIDKIVNKLEYDNALGGVLARGVFTITPPDYHDLGLISYTRFDNRLSSIGIAGYVYVNKNAFTEY